MAKAGGGGGGTSRFRSSTTGGSITKVSSSIDGVDPFIQVSYKVPGAGGETVTETTTISGATSQTMTISCNCLLYTSPSPRDLSTSRMPSSA